MAPVMNCTPHRTHPRVYPRIAHADTLRGPGPGPGSAAGPEPTLDALDTLTPHGVRRAFTSALGQDAKLDLQVTYTIDSPAPSTPGAPAMPLTSRCLMGMGLDPQALHEQALDNLQRKAGANIATQDLTVYKALVTGHDLEASMLVLPELWARLSRGFKGELIAAVPSQNALYYMDSGAKLEIAGEPISASTMLQLMCSSAARVKAEAGARGLSDQVIALTPEGWKVRGTFEAHAAALQV
ncbi:hypothetical protein SAMN05444746_11433 [Variovorax sp. OK212]|nr:hypothetical protein SAMN05518853_11433 [Variovorax sp. OK202]SFD96272.1 hypothetical protein SAMN05444746_11433 [Variovorax sp. OK212]